MSAILNAINYFWKLGFSEEMADLYVKQYPCSHSVSIDVLNEIMEYGSRIKVSDGERTRFTQKNFIILEAIDRVLRNGYRPEAIHIGRNPSYDFSIEKESDLDCVAFQCIEWEEEYDVEVGKLGGNPSLVQLFFDEHGDVESLCVYTSRLKAGTIECRYTVFSRAFTESNSPKYRGRLFEDRIGVYYADLNSSPSDRNKPEQDIEVTGDFRITDGELTKYTGNDRHVIIPSGVVKLRNSVFMNCHFIERVTIPETVYSLGGDTFYNCEKLIDLTIPNSVIMMGDNPFANCPKLKLFNKSDRFILEDGGLFDKEMTRLIYCAINRESEVYNVPDGLISISKHSFYNCQNLRKIVIPSSVKIMENNPLSNLPNMRLENYSPYFIFNDGALYNKTMTTLFYYEHGYEFHNLVIPEGVKIIGRHSFFNCQTIKKVTIPSTVEIIGYNPFTNCSGLTLENHSREFVYENGTLYDKDKSVLIYRSIPDPGEIFIVPNTVRKIGRSAFFGCNRLRRVVIPESVLAIDRSAFANCVGLEEVTIPNSVKGIGEWAFLNCPGLEIVSIPKHTSVASQTFLDCPAQVIRRES